MWRSSKNSLLWLCFLLTFLAAQRTASSTCDFDFEIGGYNNFRGTCSGHGECINNTCVCEDGFTGLSDWLNTENLDCQINIKIYKAFWGLNAAFAVLFQFKTFPKMKLRYDEFREKQKAIQASGKSISIRQNRGLVAILFYEFWVFPALLICAAVKIAKDDERVGITPLITVLFAMVKIGFYFGVAYMFQPSLIRTLLQSGSLKRNKKIQRLILLSDAFARLNLFFSVTFSFVPFITLFNSEELDRPAEIAWIIYFGGSIVSLLFYFAQAVYLKSKIVKVLDSIQQNNSQVAETKKKLVKIQKTVMFQSLFQSCLYSLFLFWPYLWNKHDYFLPLSWLAFILISKELAESHVSSGNSSSKGRRIVASSHARSGGESYGDTFPMSKQSSFGASRNPAPPSMPAIEPPVDDPMDNHI